MEKTKTPWHLWLVGGLAVLWNAFGAVDYVLTEATPQTYLRSMGLNDAQIAYTVALPDWMVAVWAIGVWAGLTAAIHLLVKRRWAVPLFAGSFVAILVSIVYQHVLTDSSAVMGPTAWTASVVVASSCAAFLAYSWVMKRRGILR